MLCNFAWAFPPFVENFLDRSQTLRRAFREETITDIMMSNLVLAGMGRVIVEFPDEPLTGADMEWNFVNPDDMTFFRIRLQAKKASGAGQIWKRHSYTYLLHATGSPPALQATTLCQSARMAKEPTYPLYVFYHSRHTCELARLTGNLRVHGLTLVDGYTVEGFAKLAEKSVGAMEPNFFYLSDVFCPTVVLPMGPMAFSPSDRPTRPLFIAPKAGRTSVGYAVPPSPNEIWRRLATIREKTASAGQLPELPTVASSIPDEVLALVERRDRVRRDSKSLGYWRVTFISANPRDSSTAFF